MWGGPMTAPRTTVPNVTPIIVASAHRTMLGAKPENLVRVFEFQAKDLFDYVRKGAANHSEIVDALQTMAEESGLVDLYGQEHVQAMMVAAAEDKGGSADRSDAPREDAARAKPDRKLISQRLSSVEAEKIEYVWPGRLAAGKLTLIAGSPVWVRATGSASPPQGLPRAALGPAMRGARRSAMSLFCRLKTESRTPSYLG
jgi:hypothetical protein